jgi:hypothetical protein
MTEFQKADLNGDGKISQEEWEIHIKRMREAAEDENNRRDAMRRMSYFSLSGMLLFPFSVIITEYFGLSRASDLLAQMSNIYYISIAAIVGAYFGFSKPAAKKEKDDA